MQQSYSHPKRSLSLLSRQSEKVWFSLSPEIKKDVIQEIIIFKVVAGADEDTTRTGAGPLGRATRGNACFSHRAGIVPLPPVRLQSLGVGSRGTG